jgi:hypothetical protein
MTYIADPRVDAYIGALPDWQAGLQYGTGLDRLEGSYVPDVPPNKVTGQARHLLSAPGGAFAGVQPADGRPWGLRRKRSAGAASTRCCTDRTGPYTTFSDQMPH